MHLIELTLAPSHARVAIEVETIGEVRDLTMMPSRDMGRYGRTQIRHRERARTQWIVFEDYEEVMARIRSVEIDLSHLGSKRTAIGRPARGWRQEDNGGPTATV